MVLCIVTYHCVEHTGIVLLSCDVHVYHLLYYIIEWSKQYVIHGVVNVFSLNGQWFILHTLDKMILICIHLKVFKKSLTVQWLFIFLYKISKFYRFIILGSIWWNFVIFKNIFVLGKSIWYIHIENKIYEFKLI